MAGCPMYFAGRTSAVLAFLSGGTLAAYAVRPRHWMLALALSAGLGAVYVAGEILRQMAVWVFISLNWLARGTRWPLCQACGRS